ncbi:MAG TPA: hypothetical protein GX018_05365 [Bacteroidales bacterium]|nr:hypothetical protein [Bacteroidales bacterium]
MLYNPNKNEELISELVKCKHLCFQYTNYQ